MVIGISEAQEKYSDLIKKVKWFEERVKQLGFRIKKEDEFELGGEWIIGEEDEQISFVWNVPYIIEFRIGTKVHYEEDYLNARLWGETLDECLAILQKARPTKR